jgi:hypothetical protein
MKYKQYSYSIFLFFIVAFLSLGVSSAQTKEVQYLSGKDKDHTVSWQFFCTGGRNSGYWTSIQVPSCWEQQGFGTYNYGRDYKTYGKNFRFADEKGIYKYAFKVPSSWKNKDVYIVFEGSMTDTEVLLNGKPTGDMHQGAFYRFKYNITGKLQFDKANQLEVTVSKMSADASVNNAERLADYWVFGGIYRPVYLEAYPKQHIAQLSIDAKADGNFNMDVSVKNMSVANTIVADIVDAKGKIISTIKGNTIIKDSLIKLTARVNDPLLWTSETPNLYKVNVHVKAGNKILYTTSQRFGFRTIEVRRGDGIYINGTQVKLKGTNRHCWWPETGRTLNDSLQLLDVQLLKQMNMNAVRCSHYPPDQQFLDYCDSLGLYVLDEIAGWQKAYKTKVGEKIVKETVLRDVNHPSVIFWDNGNEGGTNAELDDDFLKWDISQRPVLHPHHRPGKAFNGIDCNHYEDYYSTKKILEDSLIYMPTEFLHSQDDGGAGAAMADFWELHWNAKRSGGGFIWAMIDETVMRTDMNNAPDANGLNANDGILGPHREKEGSFFALREIFSPVKITMKEWPAQFDGKIPVENRFHFTNLDQCSYQWALVNFRKPWESQPGYNVMLTGKGKSPSVAPGAKGSLLPGLPYNYKNYDALVLVATDPFNNEIYKWIWAIKNNEQLLNEVLAASDSITGISQSDSSYILSGGDVSIVLDKKTGKLLNIKNRRSDQLSFGNGPVLVQGTALLTSSKHYEEKGARAVEFTYDGNLKYTRWKIYGNGWVELEYEYMLNGEFPFAGISFSYPENFMLGSKWLGKGPYRQWKNRQEGTPVNVWSNLYNNTQTGYSPLVYPEFKGYYGQITWMEFNTVEGKFYVASKDSGLNIRLFDFYGLTGVKPHPELPAGNISFLDCIPPIGTKLALNINYNTAALGPQSEQTKINGATKRSVFFYFGLPKTDNSKEKYSRPPVDNVF